MNGPSGLVVVLALWTAIGAFALTLLLFTVILGVRWTHARRGRRRAHLLARWREIFTRSIVELPASVPALSAAEARDVLPQWAYFAEFLQGECRDNLAHVAQLAELDLYAKWNLRSRSTRDRLIAIQALGSLRDPEYTRVLRPLARADNPYLSLAAAHALMRISPREVVDEIIGLISTRPDWAPARVMAILREAGPAVVSEPLARAVVQAEPAYQPLLVLYLETADDAVALEAIRRVIGQSHDPQVIATCLYRLRGIVHPESLRILRHYLADTNWILQLHAVSGIGRLGTEDDIPDLVQMLRHKRFWVRYRAAQALSKLPTMTRSRLRAIAAQQGDRFAREILTQVITERAA